MRAVSNRMTPNTTTVSPFININQDVSGGKNYEFGDAGPPLKCSVQPKYAVRMDELGRENLVVYYDIIYPLDPGIRPRDQINWVDKGKTLWCDGSIDDCGIDNVWLVTATERPILS